MSAQTAFDLPRKITLDVIFRYSSALQGLKVPSYETADARVGWWVTSHVQLALAGHNLLQPFHAEFRDDPGPLVGIKRAIYGQITWVK
jgi:hypothetical protein